MPRPPRRFHRGGGRFRRGPGRGHGPRPFRRFRHFQPRPRYYGPYLRPLYSVPPHQEAALSLERYLRNAMTPFLLGVRAGAYGRLVVEFSGPPDIDAVPDTWQGFLVQITRSY